MTCKEKKYTKAKDVLSRWNSIFLFLPMILFWAGTCFATTIGTVFVSVLPQKYFVQQISGALLNVEVMVQPGASPATYEPKASQMRKLAGCAAYFSIGVPFEKAWLTRIAGVNPGMKIVATDRDIEKLAMVDHHHGEEQKGLEGAEVTANHIGEGRDPHIWLSPGLVKKQVHTIAGSLIELFPEYKSVFEMNLLSFYKKIDELDRTLREQFKDKRGLSFIVFHPSWGYFAHEYGLQQVALEIEGKAPKMAQLQDLIAYARENNIHVIFAQPQFSRKSVELLAREIDGVVILIDPLAEDWYANMFLVANRLDSAVQ